MEKRSHHLSQGIYMPEVEIDRITARHHLGKIFITEVHTPGRICGIARRVGFTGRGGTDLAIYRLKVMNEGSTVHITLPGFFVVDKGVFVELEEWYKASKEGARETKGKEVGSGETEASSVSTGG